MQHPTRRLLALAALLLAAFPARGLDLPYFYGFENNDLSAAGWRIVDGIGESGIGPRDPDSADPDDRGNWIVLDTPTDWNQPQYLMSPELTVGESIVLSFAYAGTVTDPGANQRPGLRVGWSSSDREIESFTWTGQSLSATSEKERYRIVLPSGTRYFAIKKTGGSDAFLDDFRVWDSQAISSLAERYGVPETSRYHDAVVKWIFRATDAYGRPWHDPDTETPGLADFADVNGVVSTNMTLLDMYWLDIDPTWNDHDILLKAGWAGTESPRPKPGSDDLTSRVYMQISNTVANTAWAPYVLQGCDLENNSWAYADPAANWQWTNATFKIKGLLPVNGLSYSDNEERNWVPQRWFVFTPTSFDANFTSLIEMVNPFSTESPGYNAGWYDYKQEHGSDTPFPVFKWDVSDRSWPAEAEIMDAENPCRPLNP